jgi:hypothetical protein
VDETEEETPEMLAAIADNPPAEVINYPDSKKWFVKPHRPIFIIQETDCYANEE